jgi:hypothetical protein
MGRKSKPSKMGWGLAAGGLAIVAVGTVAAIAYSGGDSGGGASGYQILPNCQGLVITDAAKALEYARTLARNTLNPTPIFEALFGKCGFAATTTPAFVPVARFVFLAVRAAGVGLTAGVAYALSGPSASPASS